MQHDPVVASQPQRVHADIKELATTIEHHMAGRSGIVFVRPTVSFARTVAVSRGIRIETRPGIAVLAQGSKRLRIADRWYHGSSAEYSVSTRTFPGEVDVFDSGPSKPLLGMTVDFDWTRVGRLLLEMEVEPDSGPPSQESWISGQIDGSLARSFLHVARLACSDREWDVLGEGALRELYYWALRTEAGRAVRQRFTRGGNIEAIGRAVRFIEAHLTEHIDVAAIAKAAAMSPSALFARFSDVLGHSPMQFVKRLRLERAKSRIAAGERVTTAAFEAGYASPSQFSREFRRRFGLAPSRVRRLREG